MTKRKIGNVLYERQGGIESVTNLDIKQITLRLHKDLLKELRKILIDEEMSLNNWFTKKVIEEVEKSRGEDNKK